MDRALRRVRRYAKLGKLEFEGTSTGKVCSDEFRFQIIPPIMKPKFRRRRDDLDG